MKLYNYFRSSASYRARLALNYKELKFEYIPVHLLKGGGEQHSAEYLKMNPMALVPTLEHNGHFIAETMAICLYLDDAFPETKRLFPKDALAKAKVVQLCETVNAGIQPLQNLKVQQYLEGKFGFPKERSEEFLRHWIRDGLDKLDKMLATTMGRYAFGDSVTAADCFIIPQVNTARRFKVEAPARIDKLFTDILSLDFGKKSMPDQQPDFQP